MKKKATFGGLAAVAMVAVTFGLVSSPAADHCSKEHRVGLYTLAEEGGFKTLATAVKAAGLDETLNTGGPFTVFAPTDEAFAKLPEGTLESLLKDPEALKNVLLYHVVEGEVLAKDVVELESAKMLNGESVKITVDDGVMVNSAKVTKTDVLARNGVVHVIDTVLVP
jgi:uncharacterized surface protein with fasciclin (FAS1) repeats